MIKHEQNTFQIPFKCSPPGLRHLWKGWIRATLYWTRVLKLVRSDHQVSLEHYPNKYYKILSKIKTWRRKITLLKLQPRFIDPTKMWNYKQAKTYMLITSQEIRKYEEEKMQKKKPRERKTYMQIYNNFTRATQILLTQPLAAWLYLSVLLKISNYVLCNNQVFPDKSMSQERLHLLRLTGWACCLSCGLCSVGTLELYTLVCTSNTKY